MRRLLLGTLTTIVVAAVAFTSGRTAFQTADQMARGVVFEDLNGNRKRDADERGLADVRVSNGVDIVRTDAQGRFAIPVSDDAIVFVIKPRGWKTPLSANNTPEFYYIHKPAGSPKQKHAGVEPTGPLPELLEFPLYQQKEPDEFRAILFGDPQPRNQKEVDFIAHDVVEELLNTDASFGVTLGDIVFDDLNMLEPQARAIALLGIPWYNVIGNHDVNKDAPIDGLSDETFERHFGPSYYSFDYGPVHFLVLDNIEWIVPKEGDPTYRGGLGEQQMTFIRNDLALIPDDQLVVLMMHVPLPKVHDRHDLFRLIEKRPFCMSVSGHEHVHEHRYITRDDGWMGPEPHHHVINVTVSGSWWGGARDERGIPHALMADGAPNGYSIIRFDGTQYSLDFKAAGRPADYQMQIHAPEAVKRASVMTTHVNVFNGCERTRVRMRIDRGNWTVMQRTIAKDPTYLEIFEREKAFETKPWVALPEARDSSHLWRLDQPINVPAGVHLIDIEATDRNGRTFRGRRTFRVE